jgi:thymidine kinase
VEFPAFVVNKEKPQECFDRIRAAGHRVDVLLFDEAQFFAKEPMEALIRRTICSWGYDVIIAGLSQDSSGKPFGAMPFLLAVADEVITLKAVCAKCKGINMATRTFRTDGSTEQVAVGGSEMYEPRCFSCWEEDL